MRALILSIVFAIAPVLDAANLQIAYPFNDNMVIQRNCKVPVKGTGAANSKVHITFNGQEVTGISDQSGKWLIYLAPMKAGGPFTMEIKNEKQKRIFKNIMVGDVWFLSGQSNMQYPVKKFKDAREWLKDAGYSNIRLCNMGQGSKRNIAPCWEKCSSATAKEFSALGFLFGREIYKDKKIPLGLLCTAYDGSIIARWISHDALMKIPLEKKKWEKFKKELPEKREAFAKYRAELKRRKSLSKDAVKKLPKLKYVGLPYRQQSNLYNATIKPILPFAVKGFIWYQGESDGMFSMGIKYKDYLEALITSWRKEFGSVNAPFIIVQLANYGKLRGWPEIREAQRLVAKKLPLTALAVTIDLGEKEHIHPNNKLDLAKRVALCARNLAYKENILYQGPTLQSIRSDSGKLIISFSNIDGGLSGIANGSKTSVFDSFLIAGNNKRYFPANAEIKNGKIIVWNARVSNPRYVRYAYSQNPQGTLLYNGKGLPASPFEAKID